MTIGALLLIAAPTPEVETRSFDGVGSIGTESTIEFYLLEGTYHHRLEGAGDCFVTVSVFPARDPNGVPLGDMIHADLSVGRPGATPTGSVTVSRAGWAHIEAGTGSTCGWTYSITGFFLPEGEEPVPLSERNQWWLVAGGVLVVAALAALAWRRRPSKLPEEEPPIRVWEG